MDPLLPVLLGPVITHDWPPELADEEATCILQS